MYTRCVAATVVYRDQHQNVFRPGLGVLDEDVEVTVIVEDARVDQFELGLILAPPAVLLDQPGIGKFPLRVFVEVLEVRVRWRGVEIVVEFLDVLAVIALAVG